MTYLTFLTLILASVTLGAPKVHEKRATSSTTSIKPSCSRSVICVPGQNDCGELLGRCYTICGNTTYYPPPCLAATSSIGPTSADSHSTVVTKSANVTSSSGLPAEILVSENEIDESTIESDPLSGETPASRGENSAVSVTTSAFDMLIMTSDPSTSASDPPTSAPDPSNSTASDSPTSAVSDPPTSAASDLPPDPQTSTSNPTPVITTPPNLNATSSSVECGLSTSCYDWINTKCTPAVRWGGCYDVCISNPITLVSEPTCVT